MIAQILHNNVLIIFPEDRSEELNLLGEIRDCIQLGGTITAECTDADLYGSAKMNFKPQLPIDQPILQKKKPITRKKS